MSIGRSAFTLLEMLLTLALCVVLMILVSGAMTFYVREMARAETLFRQSQVASAVLQMIEDDLRMALMTRPIDTAPLGEVLAAASAPLAQLGGSGAEGGSDSGDALPEDPLAAGSEELASDPLAAESLDVSLGGMVLQSPGVIGNTTQLQVDISRLPRLEETAIDPSLAPSDGNLRDRPSDIKTISYFVQEPGTSGGVDALEELAASSGMATQSFASGGLVRRELDRAITAHAASSGGLARLSGAGDLISPEVSAIEFEYFDGLTWMPYYSTDETGFLPPAIRVTLRIADDTETTEPVRTFTHVIFLPMSYPEDAETEEEVGVGE